MYWQVWRRNHAGEMPKEVQAALANQFRLDAEVIGRLRLFEQSGRFASRPVRFIRIVDSTLLATDTKRPLKYASFEGGHHKDSIQFEGHIEREGHVFLHDRRPRQSQFKPVSPAQS